MVKIRVLPPTQEDIRYCIEYARDEFGRKCVLRWKMELEAIYARLHILQSLFWKIFIEIIVAHCLWTTSSSFIATTKSVTKSSLLTFGTPNVLNKHYWDNSKGNYKNFITTIILIVDGENIVAYITLHYCSLIKTFLNVFKRKHPILPQTHH